MHTHVNTVIIKIKKIFYTFFPSLNPLHRKTLHYIYITHLTPHHLFLSANPSFSLFLSLTLSLSLSLSKMMSIFQIKFWSFFSFFVWLQWRVTPILLSDPTRTTTTTTTTTTVTTTTNESTSFPTGFSLSNSLTLFSLLYFIRVIY